MQAWRKLIWLLGLISASRWIRDELDLRKRHDLNIAAQPANPRVYSGLLKARSVHSEKRYQRDEPRAKRYRDEDYSYWTSWSSYSDSKGGGRSYWPTDYPTEYATSDTTITSTTRGREARRKKIERWERKQKGHKVSHHRSGRHHTRYHHHGRHHSYDRLDRSLSYSSSSDSYSRSRSPPRRRHGSRHHRHRTIDVVSVEQTRLPNHLARQNEDYARYRY